jgi:hypothetical protein
MDIFCHSTRNRVSFLDMFHIIKDKKSVSSNKKRVPQKLDAGYAIKTGACILFFLCAMGYFSSVCAEVSNNYLFILFPSAAVTVPWLVRLGVSALLLVLMAGVVAVLVRPFWLAAIAYFLAAIIYVMSIGSGIATLIVAGIFFLFMLAFQRFVSKQLKNQINFTPHPLTDMNMLLLLIMSVMVSAAFGIGYVTDAAKRSYLLPPEAKPLISNMMMGQAKSSIDAQKGTPEQKKAALESATKQVGGTVDGIEKSLLPLKPAIPYLLGIILFSALVSIFSILGFVPILLGKILFRLFRMTRFTNDTVETLEVRHITLAPAGEQKNASLKN